MQESDFREVADEFIHLAPFLSAAFMYAAAWYNIHFFYASDGASENRTKAVDYYCDQYRKMLMECMHDFSQA
ncbi:MAG: DUF3144 domain-containing protein [Candidatus Thiodiazotropha sp.]